MNHVVLMGRLTRDPELKYSQAGKAFSKFTVAVNREFNREEADFINCTAWGKMAETIAEYLRKGRKIALQGRISVSSYEQNGETKWSTEVIVDKFEFVDTANSKEGEKPLIQKKKSESTFTASNNNDEIMDDNDFPF